MKVHIHVDNSQRWILPFRVPILNVDEIQQLINLYCYYLSHLQIL